MSSSAEIEQTTQATVELTGKDAEIGNRIDREYQAGFVKTLYAGYPRKRVNQSG